VEPSAVARGLDRGDQIVDRDPSVVVADRGFLGREIDGRIDAFELVQAFLDAGRAAGAGSSPRSSAALGGHVACSSTVAIWRFLEAPNGIS
jgi:hypothetical protein